jgi:hypothetical protein
VAFPNGLFPFWVVIGFGVFGFYLFIYYFLVGERSGVGRGNPMGEGHIFYFFFMVN